MRMRFFGLVAVGAVLCLALGACAGGQEGQEAFGPAASQEGQEALSAEEQDRNAELGEDLWAEQKAVAEAVSDKGARWAASLEAQSAEAAWDKLDLVQDFRDEFDHGAKPAEFQLYIVMHDTEGGGSPEGVIESWDNADRGVAAHFVVGKDGHVAQCVGLDRIAHHAGFGDTGHNELYGTVDESRDDKAGTSPIGDWAADYGMNSYSIGIEMVHMGGEPDYPAEQLQAVDNLIAAIDAYYGFESAIIDHKMWRSGNSDTSPEFAEHLANLQDHRSCW